ncbi:MAG: hypothetical protein MUO76_21280 [Anaerolineaceae bacterium]|nr:hypothetical protein [Anaerolineaceae bacterium]
MSRIINPETGRKERDRLCKFIVKALRELKHKQEIDRESLDLIAFLIFALEQIYKTIDQSVGAWEKRGYWLKADRYRRDWEWTIGTSKNLENALNSEDWMGVAQISVLIAQKLNHIKLAPGNRLGTPWVGVWEKYKSKASIDQ